MLCTIPPTSPCSHSNPRTRPKCNLYYIFRLVQSPIAGFILANLFRCGVGEIETHVEGTTVSV